MKIKKNKMIPFEACNANLEIPSSKYHTLRQKKKGSSKDLKAKW